MALQRNRGDRRSLAKVLLIAFLVGVNIIAVSYILNTRAEHGRQHGPHAQGPRLPGAEGPPPVQPGRQEDPPQGQQGMPQEQGNQPPLEPGPPGQTAGSAQAPPEALAPPRAQQSQEPPPATGEPPAALRATRNPDTPPPDEALNAFIASYSAELKDATRHVPHYCPGCGGHAGTTDPCPSCGFSIENLKAQKDSGRTCPQGTYNKASWKYCWKHGEKL